MSFPFYSQLWKLSLTEASSSWSHQRERIHPPQRLGKCAGGGEREGVLIKYSRGLIASTLDQLVESLKCQEAESEGIHFSARQQAVVQKNGKTEKLR